MMGKPTEGPYTLIWHGNETYPYPLSIHTADGNSWIARDGTVSSEANARLLAKSWEMREIIERLIGRDEWHGEPTGATGRFQAYLSWEDIRTARALLRSIEGDDR